MSNEAIYDDAESKIAADEREKAFNADVGGAGQFRVDMHALLRDADAVRAMLCGFIPMRVDREFHRNTILMQGYNLAWPIVEAGAIPPTYRLEITERRDADGSIVGYDVRWEVDK